MSVYSYKTILSKAKAIKRNVESEQKLGETSKWGYYIAKAILSPKKDITRIDFTTAENSNGDHFGRQIKKADYLDMAKRLCKYTEKNEELPNNISVYNMAMRVSDYVYLFARILIYYDNHGHFIDKANANSKAFIKPVETTNEVYKYFVKKTGLKPKYIDDVCDWVRDKVDYQFYFDDKKSNKEVIDSKAGNCTDLLQFLVNMAIALGYKYKVIHTQCKQSGTGHVYGMFKKDGDWFIRDVACIADESRYCVWCQVPNGGYKLAENPSWFMENLSR